MSLYTTNLGPRVSATTAAGYDDGTTTGEFQVSVPFILDGSNLQTVKAASATLKDGQLSVISHSATSVILVYKSGATTYTFANDAVA